MKSSFFKKAGKTTAKESKRLNKKMIVFLLCLLVSAFLWLLLTLSKDYSITLNFPVKYVNPPEDKIIANRLPAKIDITIKASGFNLMTYKIHQERDTIVIDLEDAKSVGSRNHSYLLTNLRTDKVTAQFNNSIKILKISPDTIFLNFNKKMTKRVPVIADLKIDCEDQYQVTDTIRTEPSFIEISGAADVLHRINSVRTVPVSLKNVNRSQIVKLPLQKNSDLKQVEFSHPFVNAKVSVTKYTEASIELPVEVDNLPAGYSLKTFPDKVIVKYNVAFENYEKMNASQFRVVVDYSKIEPGSNKLRLAVVKHPALVNAVKLSTDKVEYIIRK